MPSVYSQLKDLDLMNWMLNLQDRFLFLLRIIKRKVCQVLDLPTDDDGERGENKTGAKIFLRPTFFYYLFYGTADPIFVKKRIKIKVHDCCFIFIYSSDSWKNPTAKNKRKSVTNFDWRNQKPAANHQLVFFPGHTSELLGVCLQ